MSELVGYRMKDSIATVTIDDGKVNVLSPRMQQEIGQALDRALSDHALVVLTGREGVFSAGFDLGVLKAGGGESLGMLRGGFELAARLLAYPKPVVIACTGHAIAMGAFLALSGDYRIGARGPFKITANEVAIGLTLPGPAVEICRQRLAPAYFSRVTMLAEVFDPAEAVHAGFLDRVVDAADLAAAAQETAERLSSLDMAAHSATKLRVREPALAALRRAIDLDYAAATTGSAAAVP